MIRKKLFAAMTLAFSVSMVLAGCGSEKKPEETKQTNGNSVTEETTKEAEKSEAKGSLEYTFADSVKDKAGYAEGKVTLTVDKKGSYSLFWSNDKGTLPGYYEIETVDITEDNGKAEIDFAYHVAIPADATKLIAVPAAEDKDSFDVTEAVAVYDIEASKQLKSEKALYTFSSISDVHIDEEKWGNAPAYWWEYSEDHWAKALAYATKSKVDFIVSSGDQVTNASITNLNREWNAYQYILSQSDYCNPIYECGGNHEVRQDGVVDQELVEYIKGSGLDNEFSSLESAKPYYSVVEPSTGDLFIFMALEGGYRPAQYDEFTVEQLDWLEGILKENYDKGHNIYLVQHALIKGYGPGDDLETPYYSGAMNPTLDTTKRFISILETYKDIVWISGHSHEDYELGYNYTNNNGDSCNMIHNSSVGNPTHVTDGKIDYSFNENLSQGYFVQTFENAIVFNGVNYCDEKIYPMYSYIMDGKTSKTEVEEEKISTAVGKTAGNLRSIIANANTVLGLEYKMSSYNQYQSLKKLYYEYKDADIDAMSKEDICKVYGNFQEKIATLTSLSSRVDKLEITANTTNN